MTQTFAERAQPAPNGFIQIGALAGLAVVAGLVVLVLADGMNALRQGGAFEQRTMGAMIADSAARQLIAAIDDPAANLDVEVGVTGKPFTLERADGPTVSVAIEMEAGKLDPLRSEQRTLERYLSIIRLSASETTELLARLVVSRDASDYAGAMDALHAYLLPVLSADELLRDFTVRCHTGSTDPRFASERVVAAIGAEPVTQTSCGTAFTVVARVEWDEDARYTRRVPIELTTAGRARVLNGFR